MTCAEDAIIGKTLDGVITSWNPAAERLYGYTAAEAIGQSAVMLIPPERQPEFWRVMDAIRQGDHVEHDETVVPAEHFTFSTMVLPAGCEGPLHLHTDAEEVFFVLRGNKLRFIVEHQGERFETVLKERDLFSVPPGVYRGLVNEGIEEALMCVIIGNSKPVTPTYPPDHPLSKIKRPKGAGAG